jgi:hypothetical protein
MTRREEITEQMRGLKCAQEMGGFITQLRAQGEYAADVHRELMALAKVQRWAAP